MKKMLLFVVLFITTHLAAQDFLPVPVQSKTYFTTSFLEVGNYNECNELGCILGMKVDSVVTVGSEQHYYFVKMMRGDYSYCEDDSWMGEKVIVNDLGHLFFENNADEWIMLEPNRPLGASWPMYELTDGTFFTATITEYFETDLFGVQDSVVRMEIQHVDLSGNPLTHMFNGKEILLAKQSGFLQTYDFYHFPFDTFPKSLIGYRDPVAYGTVPPVKEQIFNFNVGNEYHYQSLSQAEFPPFSRYDRWEKIVVLEKEISTNADSFSYLVDRFYFEINNDGENAPENLIGHDTFWQVFKMSNFEHLDALPYEPSYPSSSFDEGFISVSNSSGRMLTRTLNYIYFDEQEGCFMPYIGTGPFTKSYWADCLGHFKTESNGGNFWKRMVYYKKGNEEWGTPINFDSLTIVRNPVLPDNSFKIYPNPTEENITISGEDFQGIDVQAAFYQINGQVLFSKTLNFFEETELQLPELSPGLYFLKLTTGAGIYVQKVMVK